MNQNYLFKKLAMSGLEKWLLLTKLLVLLIVSTSSFAAPDTNKDARWKSWDDKLFTLAKKQNKYVILDLEAVWCHWCHVMAKTTYRNPKVTRILDKHFIAVRVDQDNRPDLANRYRDYGWPATIVFTPDGREVLKRAGYISPRKMVKLLKKLVKSKKSLANQTGKEVQAYSQSPVLTTRLKKILVIRHHKSFDAVKGSLKLNQKFIDRDSVEYSMWKSKAGDARERKRANKTLTAGLALIDPAWGGVYQYSTHGDWKHPHYEKIMQVQTGYLRAYALAWQQYKQPKYLKAALDIHKYLVRFMMSPEGSFYTSQDADLVQGQHSDDYFKLGDQQRLKLGIPRIDKHRYARENGWVIEALVVMYKVTGKKKYLQQALTATRWVLKNRYLAAGGFKHGKSVKFGPYLGDTLAMGRAMLALYDVTGDARWLKRADQAGLFITYNFKNPAAGFNSAGYKGQVVRPVPQIDENISLTRFYIALYAKTGRSLHIKMAAHGLRYLVTPAVATNRLTEPGILLAAEEYRRVAQKRVRMSRK